MSDAPETKIDEAHFSPALLGFYGSCALVSGGAGMFFFSWFVLEGGYHEPLATILKVGGACGMAVGIPGSFWCLHRARQKPEK